jgi:hypothetical protein
MSNHDDALRASNKRFVEHSLATAFEPEWWENLHDDVIFEFPYGPSLGMPDRFVGREASTDYLKTMLAQIGDLKFRDIDVGRHRGPGAVRRRVQGEHPDPGRHDLRAALHRQGPRQGQQRPPGTASPGIPPA